MLDATERLHRALVGLTFENVLQIGDSVAGHVAHERMRNRLDIVVPMAIHQVVDHAACRFGQVVGLLLNDVVEGDCLHDDYFFLVGREQETVHFAVGLRKLFAVAAVDVHRPDFAACDEGDAVVGKPCGIGLVLRRGRQLFLVLAVGIHHVENVMALVFLHAVVAHLIDDVLTVGRGRVAADASHCPECFGRHAVGLQLDVVFLNHGLCVDAVRHEKQGEG